MRPSEEQVRRELVSQWVHKADQDIRAAESLLADEPPLLYPSYSGIGEGNAAGRLAPGFRRQCGFLRRC